MGGARKELFIGKKFVTQKDALQFFKDMLSKYKPKERVREEDAFYLRHLLDRHRDREAKLGVGIDYFCVLKADYGTKCFGVCRIDGSTERFTYISCIKQNW